MENFKSIHDSFKKLDISEAVFKTGTNTDTVYSYLKVSEECYQIGTKETNGINFRLIFN